MVIRANICSWESSNGVDVQGVKRIFTKLSISNNFFNCNYKHYQYEWIYMQYQMFSLRNANSFKCNEKFRSSVSRLGGMLTKLKGFTLLQSYLLKRMYLFNSHEILIYYLHMHSFLKRFIIILIINFIVSCNSVNSVTQFFNTTPT